MLSATWVNWYWYNPRGEMEELVARVEMLVPDPSSVQKGGKNIKIWREVRDQAKVGRSKLISDVTGGWSPGRVRRGYLDTASCRSWPGEDLRYSRSPGSAGQIDVNGGTNRRKLRDFGGTKKFHIWRRSRRNLTQHGGIWRSTEESGERMAKEHKWVQKITP